MFQTGIGHPRWEETNYDLQDGWAVNQDIRS
jgi:hypothetical protein